LKKAFTYLLLVIFVFNSMGYFFIFELNKLMIKREIIRHIQKDTSAFIVLMVANVDDNPDFRRTDDHEIEFRGNLYDVILEKCNQGTTTFYCLHDTNEENLLAGFSRIYKNKLILALLDHLVRPAVTQPCVMTKPVTSEAYAYPFLISHLRSVNLSILTPPPKHS
jgi:hypothetical protein